MLLYVLVALVVTAAIAGVGWSIYAYVANRIPPFEEHREALDHIEKHFGIAERQLAPDNKHTHPQGEFRLAEQWDRVRHLGKIYKVYLPVTDTPASAVTTLRQAINKAEEAYRREKAQQDAQRIKRMESTIHRILKTDIPEDEATILNPAFSTEKRRIERLARRYGVPLRPHDHIAFLVSTLRQTIYGYAKLS